MQSMFALLQQKPDEEVSNLALPTFPEIGVIALVSVLLTAIEIILSNQMGLLSQVPTQDGLTYISLAKAYYYQMYEFKWSWLKLDSTSPLTDLVGGGYNAIPLWYWLMLLSFFLLGEGEWQCFTVRFWPTFLLLVLMWWVVRRRSNATIAIASVVITALLPVMSVGLRYSGKDFFTGYYTGIGWFLTDLRPDLLFAVLLLWAVVPLIEGVFRPTRSVFLLSGTFAALTLLTKGSTFPMLLLALAITLGYGLLVQRQHWLTTTRTATWGMLPFCLILIPYTWVGGFQRIWTYIVSTGFSPNRFLYMNPNASILSELDFYVFHAPFHLGLEGILILVLAFVLLVTQIRFGKVIDSRSLVYLLLGLTLLTLLSVNLSKNFLVGITSYLFLWLFSWTMLAPIAADWINDSRDHRRIGFGLTGYGLMIVCAAVIAFQFWPYQFQKAGEINRSTIQQVGQDLKRFLPKPQDCFIQSDLYWFSFAATYYLLDADTGWRSALSWPGNTVPSIAAFVAETVPKCNAVLVFEQDIREVNNLVRPPGQKVYPEITEDFFRLTKQLVQAPASGFKVFKTYPVAFNTSMQLRDPRPRSLTLKMYVKDDLLSSSPVN